MKTYSHYSLFSDIVASLLNVRGSKRYVEYVPNLKDVDYASESDFNDFFVLCQLLTRKIAAVESSQVFGTML